MEILDTIASAMSQTGLRSSAFYEQIAEGLVTKPVKVGRASRWPRSEIQAIVAARIAGKSKAEIRMLVVELHAKRIDELSKSEAA